MCPKCKETVREDDLQLGWSDVAVISFDSIPTPSDIDACASLPLQVHAHADDTDSNSSDTDLDLEWDNGLSETALSLHGQTLRLPEHFPSYGDMDQSELQADISDVSDDEED